MSTCGALGSLINQTTPAETKPKNPGVDDVIANANGLIVAQTEYLACDAQCEYEKKLAKLRDVYDIKEDNLQTAPMKMEVARKNYLEFKYGKDDYVTKASVALKKEADKVIAEITEIWNQEEDMIKVLIADYNSMLSTHGDMERYRDRISASVGRLDKNFAAKQNDTVTNDRKAFYQSQGVDNLRYWFYFLRWAYAAIVITYIVGVFSLPTTTSSKMKYAMLAILLLFPFVVAVIAVASFAMIRTILSKLPYNAFTMGLGVYTPALNSSTQQYNPGSVEATAISNASPHRDGGGETVAQYLGQYHPAK
tara:strand:+ start:942 stop:1865 length:924 start_codon:yes stop_codon:yes gene_type:complete